MLKYRRGIIPTLHRLVAYIGIAVSALVVLMACTSEGSTTAPQQTSSPQPESTRVMESTSAPTPATTPTEPPLRTLVPESTSTPRSTSSPEPTATPLPVPTSVPTATPVPTPTPVPTATPVPTPTPVPTATPVPTPTPVPTATPVPTPTPTPTPTSTPTPEPTFERSFGDGTWIVGVDVGPGIYISPGGPSCRWARLSSFAGGDAAFSGYGYNNRTQVTKIMASDVGFKRSAAGNGVLLHLNLRLLNPCLREYGL